MTDIVAYYGTSVEIGDQIIDGGEFPESVGNWNWLGRGTYFWIGDPSRALEWATRRWPGRAMVLRVRLRPRKCLDLTQLQGTEYLRRHYARVSERYQRKGKPLPVNSGEDRALDFLVINEVCDSVKPHFDSVMAVFPEGCPVYPGSGIAMRSQVQIAVRNPSVIVKQSRSHFVSQIVSTEEVHG